MVKDPRVAGPTGAVLTLALLGPPDDPGEADQVEQATNGLVAVKIFDGSDQVTAEEIYTLPDRIESPFLVLVRQGRSVDVPAVMERTSLLVANPAAAFVYGPRTDPGQAAAGPPAGPGAATSPALFSGRKVLQLMLGEASNVVGPPETTVIRAAALRHRAAPPVRPFTGRSWYLELWARLLAAGNVIYSPAPAAGPYGADELLGAIFEETVWWPAVLSEGRRLRALDGLGDFYAAVTAYDKRYAEVRRSGLVAPELLERAAEGRAGVLLDLHDGPIDATAKLRLHAVIAGTGDSRFAEAVGARVAKVSRIEEDLGDLLRPRTLPEALADQSTLPAAVAELSGAGGLPLLLLGVDESLDILDQDQIRLVLPELADQAGIGAVRAGAGWSRRVWSQAAAAGRGATVRPVYSVTVDPGGDREWLPAPTTDQFASNRSRTRRFVVATPGYATNSGGIVALHRLCDLLNRVGARCSLAPLGADCRPLPPGQPFATNPDWMTPVAESPRPGDDAVVIYPEIVVGNPLGARRIVRWLLNRPGAIIGVGMGEGADDLQVAFDPSFGPGRPVLRFPQVDPRLFFPKDVPGEGGLLWVHKGRTPADLQRAGLVEIQQDWPTSKEALGALLRRARVLVSCDWCTVLTHEATMCGTEAILVSGSHGDISDRYAAGQPLGPDGLDLRPMLRTDRDPAAGAYDGSAAAFDAYIAQVAGWATELTEFVDLCDRHFAAAEAHRPLATR